MKNYKRFDNFEDDYFSTVYVKSSIKDKTALWWALLVKNIIFNSPENALDLFTVENYAKWRSFEKDIDIYLESLMEDIWEHGPWQEGDTLESVRNEINKRLGKKHET